jgi:hypothetical protein
MHNLMRNVALAQWSTAVAVSATSTDITGTALDMAGYEGVVFVAIWSGTPTTSITQIHVEEDSSSGMGSAGDLSGSAAYFSTAIADGFSFVDVYRPAKQYVRYVIDRTTTDDAIAGVLALQYTKSVDPVTHSTAKLGSAVYLVHTATGTAT